MSEGERNEALGQRSLDDEQWSVALEQLKAWQYNPRHVESFWNLAKTMVALTMAELTESSANGRNVDLICAGLYTGRIRQVQQMLHDQCDWAVAQAKGGDA